MRLRRGREVKMFLFLQKFSNSKKKIRLYLKFEQKKCPSQAKLIQKGILMIW